MTGVHAEHHLRGGLVGLREKRDAYNDHVAESRGRGGFERARALLGEDANANRVSFHALPDSAGAALSACESTLQMSGSRAGSDGDALARNAISRMRGKLGSCGTTVSGAAVRRRALGVVD